jgi:acyl-CoA thioesterase
MEEKITDPIDYAREVVGRDPMATFLGIAVDEVKKGYARCSLMIRSEYLNAVERAHGIAVYAVADQAFAVACNSTGTKALAMSINVNYISGALVGETIFAQATPINIGRKISVWKIDVMGSEERLIASCEGIAYHK